MDKQFKSLYLKSLSKFNHKKSDLFDVVEISKERENHIKDTLINVMDSHNESDEDSKDSELLQKALYETDPESIAEILLLGYIVGITKQIYTLENNLLTNKDLNQ